MDGRRRVRQWVERQKAYLPTYAVEHRLGERQGTPSKPLRSDDFGFDTPVLRPRVPQNNAIQPALQVGPSKPRTHRAEPGPAQRQDPSPAPPQDTKKDKRKKAPTPVGTDSERAARLADRRERKRRKRAILDDGLVPTAAPKKGRANGQRAKRPAALALLYGFSATNVTKDRLTVKPAPALGVFGKGKASAKKKVTTAGKSSSRNAFFSESAFLNKPSADHSKIDDDSDGDSAPSIPDHPVFRTTNRTENNRDECTGAPVVKTPKASSPAAPESEAWDIEVQSNLPSSACDIPSDSEAKCSSPVVLDLRRVEWAAFIDTTEIHEERCNKTQPPSLSVTRSRSRAHSVVCSSLLAMLDPHDGPGSPHAVDASSIRPCHSASQVGRHADIQPCDFRPVASKYFIGRKPVSVQELAADPPQTSRLNDDRDVLDSSIPGQDVEGAALDVQAIHRVASPISSLMSVPQPVVGIQTRYDMVAPEFPSDGSPYDDYDARVDVPWDRGTGYMEPRAVETPGDRITSAAEYHQSTTWDWSRSWWRGSATDDVEGFEGTYDPAAWAHEDALVVDQARCDLEGHFSEPWVYMAEGGGHAPVDRSICFSDESAGDVPGFLEGRALLLGIPEDHEARSVGLSGLAQAEMDVASRLRDHWRPLRL